jgi:hypothetical protein
LYRSRFGVPAGLPLIAPAVALATIPTATVSDGASPRVALSSAVGRGAVVAREPRDRGLTAA